jgi:hypothetical protein
LHFKHLELENRTLPMSFLTSVTTVALVDAGLQRYP